MPSASVKVQDKDKPPVVTVDSTEPFKQTLTLVEHKIRNMEKRKGKLDAYKQEQEQGKELNADQLAAVAKYGELLSTLEFARDLVKQLTQIQSETSRQLKKQQKREQLERATAEVNKTKQMLLYTTLCHQLAIPSVRENFVKGKNGAILLGKDDLMALDELTLSGLSVKRGTVDEQLEVAAEQLLNLVDGKVKPVSSKTKKTYKDLKDMLISVTDCDYYDATTETSEAETEDKEEVIVPCEEWGVEGEYEVEAEVVVEVEPESTVQETSETSETSEPSEEVLSAASSDCAQILAEETPYSFIQESQIDIESPHMDPAVVAVSSFLPPNIQHLATGRGIYIPAPPTDLLSHLNIQVAPPPGATVNTGTIPLSPEPPSLMSIIRQQQEALDIEHRKLLNESHLTMISSEQAQQLAAHYAAQKKLGIVPQPVPIPPNLNPYLHQAQVLQQLQAIQQAQVLQQQAQNNVTTDFGVNSSRKSQVGNRPSMMQQSAGIMSQSIISQHQSMMQTQSYPNKPQTVSSLLMPGTMPVSEQHHASQQQHGEVSSRAYNPDGGSLGRSQPVLHPLGDPNQNNYMNDSNGEYDEWEPDQKSHGAYDSNGDNNLDRSGADYYERGGSNSWEPVGPDGQMSSRGYRRGGFERGARRGSVNGFNGRGGGGGGRGGGRWMGGYEDYRPGGRYGGDGDYKPRGGRGGPSGAYVRGGNSGNQQFSPRNGGPPPSGRGGNQRPYRGSGPNSSGVNAY